MATVWLVLALLMVIGLAVKFAKSRLICQPKNLNSSSKGIAPTFYRTTLAFGSVCLGICLFGTSAKADIIFSTSGLSSAGVPVGFRSTFTISGNTLTVKTENISPGSSLNPNDVLGSLYFDIVNGSNIRPTLVYSSAIGNVYSTLNPGTDTLFAANDNLKATGTTLALGFDKWQFKTFNPALTPFSGFGLGTVGNNGLSPNSFNGNIAGAIDYGLYKGDVSTNNLRNKKLVRDSMTMVFTGVSGFTESQIGNITFGLGTAPDSLMTGTAVPEPSSFVVLSLLAVGMAYGSKNRKR